jgi:tetratricopeptide (TPR) repeat protein
MGHPADLESGLPLATDGDIAVTNLESARQQSWSRFWRAPERPGIAEGIVEQEQFAAQFLGDLVAFERLETLDREVSRVDADPQRALLIKAQIASMSHRFEEARGYLAQAKTHGAPAAAVQRLSLSIDQACGNELMEVLEIRHRMVAECGSLENLVPLGAVLADLREFDEADRIYQRALREYQEVSPFAVAWVCFQLGALWGELVPEPEATRAAQWYRKAIEYLPGYVKARVHLAELCLCGGRTEEAEGLLMPVLSAGDPEVNWRLADVLNAAGRAADADVQMQIARSGFESLLAKYPLAFADHGAEFYSGSGNDARRAFELARVNLENRPTLRAFEQAHASAVSAGEPQTARDILTAAGKRWGGTAAFRFSPLATLHAESVNNDPGSFTARPFARLSTDAAV